MEFVTTYISISRWVDKKVVVYIYHRRLLNHQKEQNNSSCSNWIDLEIIIFSEVSQKDKDHMTLLICGIYNMTQMNLSMKQK